MGICRESIASSGEEANDRKDFWEGNLGQEGLRVSRDGTQQGQTNGHCRGSALEAFD